MCVCVLAVFYILSPHLPMLPDLLAPSHPLPYSLLIPPLSSPQKLGDGFGVLGHSLGRPAGQPVVAHAPHLPSLHVPQRQRGLTVRVLHCLVDQTHLQRAIALRALRWPVAGALVLGRTGAGVGVRGEGGGAGVGGEGGGRRDRCGG